MMSDEEPPNSPIEALAAEFAEALRQGNHPSIDDYVARVENDSNELRDMLLTILAMERLKEQNTPAPPTALDDSIPLGRLGDFRIVREIGRGGMGIVYEAVQESLDRTVAVKVLPKHRLNSDVALARFQRESRTAAGLHHSNIVPVLGVGADEGYHYYVMQLIRGVGLDEVIGHLRADTSVTRQAETVTPAIHSVARDLIERTGNASTVDTSQVHTVTQNSPIRSLVDTDDQPPSLQVNRVASGEASRTFNHVYWQSVAWIAHRVASALQYAHEQGVLHRDIKPSNLLIDSQGEVSIADFGLAKSIDQAGISRTGDVVGTLRYMAPEQLSGTADNRSDVYSLGVTIYEMATLKPAYDEGTLARTLSRGSSDWPARPSQVRPGIPSDLETIIVKAMSMEPRHRYQSAAELSEDLRRFHDDHPIRAKRTSFLEHSWRWSRRNPAIATLCVVTACLWMAIATVSTTAYYWTNHARQVAIEQRDKADRTAESAFDALDQIFHSLAPTPMVNPAAFVGSSETDVGLLEAPEPTKQTAALLDKMLTFYDQIAAAGQSDERYLKRLAEANHRIGDIRQRLGQVDLAAEAYHRSARLYRRVIASDESPGLVARLAAVHNELGICFHNLRRLRKPLPALLRDEHSGDGSMEFQDARRLLEPIAIASAPPEVRYELAHTYYLLGDEPRRGGTTGRRGETQLPSAERQQNRSSRQPENHEQELLKKAAKLLEPLVSQYPQSPNYRHLLAMCYMEFSKEPSLSSSPQGQQLRSDAIKLLTELAGRAPENADYRFALSSAYASGRVNSPHLDRDSIQSYITRLQTAETILAELRIEHPTIPKYLVAHLKLLHQLGTLHRRLDGPGAELPVLRRATQVFREAHPESMSSVSLRSVIEVYDRTTQLLMTRVAADQQEALMEAQTLLQDNLDAFGKSGHQHDDPIRARFLDQLAELQDKLSDLP